MWNCFTTHTSRNTTEDWCVQKGESNLLDIVWSMMDEPCKSSTILLGIRSWNSAFMLNRCPSKSVEKTPYEMWTIKGPNFSFLKIWSSGTYVKHMFIDKLGPKSDKCFFVGYPKETKGYYFYNPTENKMFVARSSIFLER